MAVGSPGRYSRASRRRGLSASQWAMNFWGMEALSAMKRLSGVMGQISGMVALRLCFTAERAMRSRRSGLSSLRSDQRQSSGTRRSNPVSVSFSTSHSMRSRCLVGATATVMGAGQNGGTGVRPTISTRVRLGCASVMRQLRRVPRPSITSMRSPSLWRSTFTQCCDSPSGSTPSASISGA